MLLLYCYVYPLAIGTANDKYVLFKLSNLFQNKIVKQMYETT